MRHTTALKSTLFVLFLAVALTARAGNRPVPRNEWDISTQDAIQNQTLLQLEHTENQDAMQINKHLESTDVRVQANWEMERNNQEAIASMQAENRVWFSILGLLFSGSVVAKFWGSVKAREEVSKALHHA